MASRRLIGWIAFLLGCTFLAFQVEPGEAEYEQNHPAMPDGPAISPGGVSWEMFGKEDAPQPFLPDAGTTLVCLCVLPSHDAPASPHVIPSHPVRDKSPPLPS